MTATCFPSGGGLCGCVDFVPLHFRLCAVKLPVGDEALQQAHGDRLIYFCPAAVKLTRMGANPPADGGEGNRLTDQVNRFLESPLGDQGDVALDMDAARAGIGARSFTFLHNRRAPWLTSDVNHLTGCCT